MNTPNRPAQHGHDQHEPDKAATADEYWEDFYRDRVWSGRVNPLLEREVRDGVALPPGTVLDLGCGEGADALWLARNGWRVRAVDVSATALRRGAEHAAEQGVAEAIEWERHDLARSFPEGTFDLVSAQFLHSPVAADGEREAILARAAEAVAPGGVLLIIGHAGWPTWMEEPPADIEFPTAADVLAALGLPAPGWDVERAGLVSSEVTGPEGQPGRREDCVVRVRRTG
ncbi:SAM-dependent methyltransferase [Saccharomonospora piscinae]|uniref:SAM-dependent methyltransferase n=1 Tax=Saccharomonospora piscinae TaxID=687388 RepID=A0A1V9ABV1_SACPI|nr:class I SAM-dependent methyltransferase [Saccharomonospora piscinae]OQO94609.1 SAM-dependent methyltransferase [Saccharomonospora piscinae]TLW94692.1 class I SAM-dependent methyltransferase [Saccharomonospora piscinae]